MGGRHYNHDIGADMRSSPSSLLAAVAAGEAKCAAGEHDERVVPSTRRAYGPYGVVRPPGSRYCGRCQVDLDAAGEPVAASREQTTTKN